MADSDTAGHGPTANTVPTGLVILGHPIAHSLSPVFQGAALAACGFTQRYDRVDTPPATLDATLADCRQRGLGGNVTVPLKELVAARAARCSAVAARAGAVNTFWFDNGELIGHNTDVDGVLATLDALVPSGELGSVVVLGAGGSAAAVLVALSARRVDSLAMVARPPARAATLLARTQVSGQALAPDAPEVTPALRNAGVVINCTPVGMLDEQQPVAVSRLGPRTAVFDLVYRATGTAWVHAARASGRPAEDGLRMLVEQGAAAFRCWFGVDAPRETMWHALGAPVPPVHRPRDIPRP